MEYVIFDSVVSVCIRIKCISMKNHLLTPPNVLLVLSLSNTYISLKDTESITNPRKFGTVVKEEIK
jgi:hypothetical protein